MYFSVDPSKSRSRRMELEPVRSEHFEVLAAADSHRGERSECVDCGPRMPGHL
jgi:hypothetical protein